MSDLSRDDFLLHIGYLREDIGKVQSHLSMLNSRTYKAESDIALLQATSAATLPPRSKASSAAWSGGVGGIVIGMVEAARWWFSKP